MCVCVCVCVCVREPICGLKFNDVKGIDQYEHGISLHRC